MHPNYLKDKKDKHYVARLNYNQQIWILNIFFQFLASISAKKLTILPLNINFGPIQHDIIVLFKVLN